MDIGSSGISWCVFLSPFASDVVLSILQFQISTLALPTSISMPSLTLVVHALNVARFMTIHIYLFLIFGHRCTLPMTLYGFLTIPL